MVSVNVIGNVIGDSGYSSHTRGLVAALARAGVDVSLEHAPIPPNLLSTVPLQYLELIQKKPPKDAWHLVIDLPYVWSLKSATKRVIGYGVFEGSQVHTSWRMCANRDYVKQIWVPSTHTKSAFENGGVTKDLQIVPHGVDLTHFNPKTLPLEQLKSDRFTFLFSGGWSQGGRDRKGLDIALQAFDKEFSVDEPVRFIAKINTVYNKPGYTVVTELDKLGLRPATQRPQIVLIQENMPYALLPSLYATADVFVLPTKAEGFGLTALEAMACGKPVIATDYGGQLDFVNEENGWLIQRDLEPATDENVFYEEALWGIPRVNHLRQLMREAFENRQLVEEKGKKARLMAEQFSWDAAAARAKAYLEELT